VAEQLEQEDLLLEPVSEVLLDELFPPFFLA